jgi:hypothetical protein
MGNSHLEKKYKPKWTVRGRLNLLAGVLIFALAMAIFGEIEIYKGAKFHQYNFLHVKFNHQFNSQVDIFKTGHENISDLRSIVHKVQKQPMDCLEEATFVERFMMKMIGTYPAITLCENDITLGDKILLGLNDYQKHSIAREELIIVLDDGIKGFSEGIKI